MCHREYRHACIPDKPIVKHTTVVPTQVDKNARRNS